MRAVPFREVLHAVAFKLGLDPDQSNFLTNQAVPIGTYIDQWTSRVWNTRDWPELVQTAAFTPDSNHIVPWGSPNDTPVFGQVSTQIDRVLKVFLVDPNTTDAPIDTHYTLLDAGIHCGYEHGTQVWIRFMPPASNYTAVTWRPDTIFSKNDITYSPFTGHVYKSKVNGNQGIDPARNSAPPANMPELIPDPIQLQTNVTQYIVPAQPGTPAFNKILVAKTIKGGPSSNEPTPVPNPPPNLSALYLEVVNAAGTSIGFVSTGNNGTDTLDVILDSIKNSLVGQAGMAGFIITVNPTALTLTFEHASEFTISSWKYIPFNSKPWQLAQQQLQAYLPAVPPVAGQPQMIEFPLNNDQAVAGAIYTLLFRDVAGGIHDVSYTAVVEDGPLEILSGLVSAIINAQGFDPYFNGVQSTIDTTSNVAVFASFSAFSIDASMLLAGSPWWELVPFPEVLVLQVERGAFADLYKEWGQEDKGLAEEQLVPSETQGSEEPLQNTPNPPLTGQQRALSRYKL